MWSCKMLKRFRGVRYNDSCISNKKDNCTFRTQGCIINWVKVTSFSFCSFLRYPVTHKKLSGAMGPTHPARGFHFIWKLVWTSLYVKVFGAVAAAEVALAPNELTCLSLCSTLRGLCDHSRVHLQRPISCAESSLRSANQENGRLYRIWMRSVSFGAIFEWAAPERGWRDQALNIKLRF